MTSTHDPFTGPGPHVAPDGAASGETGPDGLDALPGWLRRAVPVSYTHLTLPTTPYV